MTASILRSKLAAHRFVLTAEITPPLSTDPQDLIDKAAPLRGLADAVNVTDGASARVHMEAIAAAALMQNAGVEPVLQVTCRDRNRIALQSLLVGAGALGIPNLMFLTGDDPKMGDQPDAKPVFDIDSTALTSVATSIRDAHQLPHGRAVEGHADYFVGIGDVPQDPPEGWTPKSLLKKIAAGAQFAQTQFCMDTAVLKRYLARCAESGVPQDFPFIVGVAPLASAKSAHWIKEHLFGSIIPDSIIERLDRAEDQKAEGRAICIELIGELAEIPGVAGAHVMAPLNEASLPLVLQAVRKTR
jgi:methylenetetrahydrofolate reductase (NADPH)